MGNGGQGTYAPLSYLDRLKIRAATKHLHSRFLSVRQAAHKEIQRILQKRRQSLKARIDPKKWARQAWERVNYGKQHKCGNCNYSTRDKDMFRHHAGGHMRENARTQGPAATPGLRERQAQAQGRSQARTDARTPDSRQAASRQGQPRRHPSAAADLRQQAGLLPQRDQKPPARTPASSGQRMAAPSSRPSAAVRTAPLPHETVRVPKFKSEAKLRMPRFRLRARA